MNRKTFAAFIALSLVALVAPGCGGGGSSTSNLGVYNTRTLPKPNGFLPIAVLPNSDMYGSINEASDAITATTDAAIAITGHPAYFVPAGSSVGTPIRYITPGSTKPFQYTAQFFSVAQMAMP